MQADADRKLCVFAADFNEGCGRSSSAIIKTKIMVFFYLFVKRLELENLQFTVDSFLTANRSDALQRCNFIKTNFLEAFMHICLQIICILLLRQTILLTTVYRNHEFLPKLLLLLI